MVFGVVGDYREYVEPVFYQGFPILFEIVRHLCLQRGVCTVADQPYQGYYRLRACHMCVLAGLEFFSEALFFRLFSCAHPIKTGLPCPLHDIDLIPANDPAAEFDRLRERRQVWYLPIPPSVQRLPADPYRFANLHGRHESATCFFHNLAFLADSLSW